jgi:hypothetical protein
MNLAILFTRDATALSEAEIAYLHSFSPHWAEINTRVTESYGARKLFLAMADETIIPLAQAAFMSLGADPHILGVWQEDGLPWGMVWVDGTPSGTPVYPCVPQEYIETLPDLIDPVTQALSRPTEPLEYLQFSGWAARIWPA